MNPTIGEPLVLDAANDRRRAQALATEQIAVLGRRISGFTAAGGFAPAGVGMWRTGCRSLPDRFGIRSLR